MDQRAVSEEAARDLAEKYGYVWTHLTDPLPQLFVKKAVAALFAKVCMEMSARISPLRRANICVNINDILLDTPLLKTEERRTAAYGIIKPVEPDESSSDS